MDRNIGSRSTPRRRQELSPMNMQIGSSETEEGLKTYTKQDVEMLLTDKFKGKKFDSKGKQEWTIEYIKRLKVCLKWLQDVVDEKDGLQTALESQEEEFKVTISKLETNILSLSESLAKEESEKLGALDCLKKEKEANMALEKNQESLRKELGWAEQTVLNANEKVKMQEHMYASLQEYNTHLQDELREANRANKQVESEKAVILQELSTLRAHTPFLQLHDELREANRANKQLESEKAAILQELVTLRDHNTLSQLQDELREANCANKQLESEKAAILQELSTLRAHNTFHAHLNYNGLLNPELKSRVNSWIRYAISRNVEELDLRLWGPPEGEFTYDDELFFNSSCITRIALSCCLLDPPNGAISWGRLESLCISCSTLNEDMLEKILSGSPCLETLELEDCYGYSRINITSKSVKELVISGYISPHEIDRDEDYIDCVKINAPYILSLTIEGALVLRELALLNVSSLVEAYLDYSIVWGEISQREIFTGLIISLNDFTDIRIGPHFSEFLSRLEANRVENGDQEEESD
ncbi:ribonuclease H-like domain-containing protein [Tanacetum coccineum]|uniref:Ribonuclease H-like domain-containing protein n=1 Tax=Tanacetum coccineum TaxID=301880 RepID=A0ABQ5HS36_9ASTR